MQRIDKNYSLIIRSVGERTEGLCAHLIKSQSIDDNAITIINEKPFSLALKKSYEVGLIKNKQWTLCVDADLLLRPGSIEHFIHITSGVDKSIFEIQGYILDKLFGGPRIGGIHLYRTCLLEKALMCIPEDESEIRPENRTLSKMKESGFPFLVFPFVVGLHDFEQYYKDIFRKCFIQARKHQMFLDLFVPFWQSKAKEDKDFDIALKGLSKGIEFVGDVGIDATHNTIEEYFSMLKVEEKEPLLQECFGLSDIEKIINSWQEPQDYIKKFPDKMGLVKDQSHIKEINFGKKPNKIGKINSILYYFGTALFKFSKLQKKLAVTLINKSYDK